MNPESKHRFLNINTFQKTIQQKLMMNKSDQSNNAMNR